MDASLFYFNNDKIFFATESQTNNRGDFNAKTLR